jgi:choline monooxygenase
MERKVPDGAAVNSAAGAAGPLSRARALDPAHYFGDATQALERRVVFGRTWQLAAHRAQLSEAGDHVLTDVAGTPVVLLRGADGVLRAFPNVCRHRAGPLVLCSGKGAGTLRCRYHGWLYSQDGRLLAAPEMQDAADFRVADIRLPSFLVREWEGLVFIALDERVPWFEQVYAGIVERIRPVDLGAMQFVRRDQWDVACNWKVYVDNFLEGYHVPMVHPALARAVDYASYDVDLAEWYSLQHSPLRGSDAFYGEGEALYYFVFPNVMLNVMPGRLQTNRVLPLGPSRCRVEFEWFYSPDPQSMSRVDNDREFTNAIQEEDVAICEQVQRGLASGHYEPGRLCPRREAGVWHFHERLRAAYAQG